jgi:hypothetical protein
MYQHATGQKRFPMATATFWEGILVPTCQNYFVVITNDEVGFTFSIQISQF